MAEQNVQRRFGDRKEGRMLRSLSRTYRMLPYLIPRRTDAAAFFSDSAEISDTEQWLAEKREDGWQGLGLLHVFLAAYVRLLSERPDLNRFISGQHYFARNSVDVVLLGRRESKSLADDTVIKVHLDTGDTVFDIYRKLAEKSESRRAGDENGQLERLAFNLLNLPGVSLRFALGFLNLLDYFGLLTGKFIRKSPFHGSMAITAMESTGAHSFYHPLYPIGNLPVFFTVGARRKVRGLNQNGESVERLYLDFQGVFDRRIADSYAWASAMDRFRSLMQAPKVLENRPIGITEDIF